MPPTRRRMTRLLVLPACALLAALAHAAPPAPDVLAYVARVEPMLATRSVAGSVVVRVAATGATLVLDRGALVIDEVRVADVPVRVDTAGARLRVPLPPSPGTAPREVFVAYHGTPAGGLVFRPEAQQMHTAFSTSQWLPCVDSPAERATLDLTLVLPRGTGVAATGAWRSTGLVAGGRIESRWVLDTPMPSYLYGFAAGPFRELTSTVDGVELRVLATPAFTEDETRRVFADTAEMLRFFATTAGRPYPHARYTQVLVAGPAAQEMAGMAVLGERWGRRVLADSTDTWLGAHELAHQWWGNGVTNAAWTHFWLNEGFASYLADLWLEHRHGRAAYDDAMGAVRANVDSIRARGHERSLVFPHGNAPTADDRSLAYDKGALVLERLRAEIGDEAFGRVLRAWTTEHWGRAVTTADFEATAARVSGRDLRAFFARWVHARVR